MLWTGQCVSTAHSLITFLAILLSKEVVMRICRKDAFPLLPVQPVSLRHLGGMRRLPFALGGKACRVKGLQRISQRLADGYV